MGGKLLKARVKRDLWQAVVRKETRSRPAKDSSVKVVGAVSLEVYISVFGLLVDDRIHGPLAVDAWLDIFAQRPSWVIRAPLVAFLACIGGEYVDAAHKISCLKSSNQHGRTVSVPGDALVKITLLSNFRQAWQAKTFSHASCPVCTRLPGDPSGALMAFLFAPILFETFYFLGLFVSLLTSPFPDLQTRGRRTIHVSGCREFLIGDTAFVCPLS